MCAGLSKDCFCSPTCIIQFINTKTVVLLKLVEFFHLWLGPYSSSPSGLDIALSRTHTCSSGGSGWCPVGPCSSPGSQAKASWDPVHLWTCTSSSGGSSWCPVGPCTSFQGEGSWDSVHFCTCTCSIGGDDWCSASPGTHMFFQNENGSLSRACCVPCAGPARGLCTVCLVLPRGARAVWTSFICGTACFVPARGLCSATWSCSAQAQGSPSRLLTTSNQAAWGVPSPLAVPSEVPLVPWPVTRTAICLFLDSPAA